MANSRLFLADYISINNIWIWQSVKIPWALFQILRLSFQVLVPGIFITKIRQSRHSFIFIYNGNSFSGKTSLYIETAPGRAGVKYVFVFANTNTNTNTAYLYLYLYLIKFQAMYLYLYLYLIHRICCIWQIRFQIHFFPGPFSKHKFIEHKLTWIFFINMLNSVILFQNKCRGLILLIPIGDCVCALDLACQWVCDKPLAELYWHGPRCNATWASKCIMIT